MGEPMRVIDVQNTTQLQDGDVVLNHGMEIEISGPPRISPGEGRGAIEVWVWDGHVRNGDEICAEDPFIRSFLRGGNRHPDQPLDTWNIQGNALARWTVLRVPATTRKAA